MKEAMFYTKLKEGAVKCNLCARNCSIPEGNVGFCGVRKNIGGKLYSLVYDKLHSAQPDHIEKKPLYHFAPGSYAFSICTIGCNWRCKFCCNWMISQEHIIRGETMSPEEIVRLAIENNCQGISYTYTEPTIFYELAYDTAKIAHKQGLFNTFVTNGYTSPKAIRKIGKYLDAATIDFKGSGDPKFLKEFSAVQDSEPIFRAVKEYKRCGVHVEITDLLVPKKGDSMQKVKELVEWIKKNLGPDVPVHFIRFYPNYLVNNIPPTPVSTLEKAIKIAENLGMKYCYIGNVLGHPKNNTYCPNCKTLLIERWGMSTKSYRIVHGRCPECGEKINIMGEEWIPSELRFNSV